MKKPIYIVVAVEKDNGIGKNRTIPWHLKKEIKFFKELTTETEHPDNLNMVIMGRTTWESIPDKFRPLPGRKNVVLTRNSNYEAKDAFIANSLNEAFEMADENIEKIYIIGGARVYEQSIKHPALTGLYITKIDKSYDCDTFFPEIPKEFNKIQIIRHDVEDKTIFKYFLITKKN